MQEVLNSVVASLAAQGMALLDVVRKGMDPAPGTETAAVKGASRYARQTTMDADPEMPYAPFSAADVAEVVRRHLTAAGRRELVER